MLKRQEGVILSTFLFFLEPHLPAAATNTATRLLKSLRRDQGTTVPSVAPKQLTAGDGEGTQT
jgi:hypothetical protein